MFMWFSKRLRDDEGFTLIELMVVVLIIAILIAIAIPTFLGARRRAQDRQAQSNLRNGLTAEKTYYADAQGYSDDTGAGLTALQDIESNLAWNTDDAAARGANVVEVTGGTTSDQAVVLQSLSKSGTQFCIMDIAQSGITLRGQSTAGTFYHKDATSPYACPATGWSTTTDGWK